LIFPSSHLVMTGGDAAFGRGRGREGGPPSECLCPNCGHTEPHERGRPCSSLKCPRCGTRMIGKWER